MTIEERLVAALSALFSGRLYPDVAPIETVRPYGVYQKIGGRSINYTSNEIPAEQHSLVQINIWADSRLAASGLARQVEDALRQSLSMAVVPEAEPVSLHDSDLNRYGTSQDFSVFSAR